MNQQPPSNSTASPAPLRVFVSYAHKDSALKEQFETNLKVLTLRDLITTWSDKHLAGGERWDEEIAGAMRAADVIIFMVSNAFLTSDYIRRFEMPFAVAQVQAGRAVIIPVILKQCAWEEEEWSAHQALPMGVKPITEWSNTEAAFTEVEKGLRKVLERLRNQKIGAPRLPPAKGSPGVEPLLTSGSGKKFSSNSAVWIGAGGAFVVVLALLFFAPWKKNPSPAASVNWPVPAASTPRAPATASSMASPAVPSTALMKTVESFASPPPVSAKPIRPPDASNTPLTKAVVGFASPAPAGPRLGNLRHVLLSHSWSWTDTHTKLDTVITFREDGTFFKASHYTLTGPQTVEIVLNNGYRTTLNFDESFQTFTNNSQISGKRMAKIQPANHK